ncbi:MAG TPA: SRPBCC family protein [Burkholderiales bacterium]|jgi:phenylpropionate dioxygenase-like ring-hydroxylating dioxygenase large terminal subunit
MSIAPEAYSSAEIFAREQERVFGARLFVGSAWRVESPNAYRAYLAGKRALVTRGNGEDFATLENVCLHRGNLIHPLGYGEQPMRCGYHGWHYETDGRLRVAPLSDPGCVKHKQLQGYPTANVEGLLFAGLDGNAPALDAVRNALEAVGFAPEPGSKAFHAATLPHRANWKLLVENVLEAYHLSFLHGPSFVAQGFSSTTGFEWNHQDDCSWHFMAPKDGEDAKVRRLIPDYKRGYTHAYVAPNLFIGVTSGLIAYVGHFLPIGPGETLLEYELWETPLLMRQKTAIRDYFKEQAITFGAQVLEEDRVLLETSQIGLQYARHPCQLQPCEARVAHFHQVYNEAMHAA